MPAPGLRSADREQRLARLSAERFDCLIVGGGITGAGLAHEAARRDLRVALLEAGDFACGTSSRSSKLIHGGLRYLALGDVATVRSTARERKVVRRLAPHLAEPCWMVVPTRSRAGLAKLRAAIAAYETLGQVEEADRHRNWSASDLAKGEPTLDRRLHPHACVYREYRTHDARLVLANLRAAAGLGAQVLSRLPVRAVLREGERATGVEAECLESGARIRVRARSIVNATGPWVDALRRLEQPEAQSRLHLSKGVHVVLRRERLPVRNIVILGTDDRRSIFAVPRGEAVYVGTTDTTYRGAREAWPEIEPEDVDYLLAPLARYFSVDRLGPEDVFSAWAGLRPLVAQAGKAPSEISRHDELWVGPAGVVTVAGGKLTGYRPMAERALARAAAEAGLRLAEAPAEPDPLPGGQGAEDLEALAAALRREHGGEAATAARLARLYGSEASQVLARGSEPLASGARIVAGEVDWAVEMEDALHLEDLLYRRTAAALYDPGVAQAVEPAALRMGTRLGWSQARRDAEVAAVRARSAADLAFKHHSKGGGEARSAQEVRA